MSCICPPNAQGQDGKGEKEKKEGEGEEDDERIEEEDEEFSDDGDYNQVIADSFETYSSIILIVLCVAACACIGACSTCACVGVCDRHM